ncbi:MAG: protein TolQ [Deltaproteobacteria bacterium]|nr:protein TolQ [Deltaproteobacteria bacterium]
MTGYNMDILHIMLSAGAMVKFVLIVLIFFSITSWAIIISKYIYIKKAYKESVLFSKMFWKSKNFSDAYAMSKQFVASPLSRAFRVCYTEMKKKAAAERHNPLNTEKNINTIKSSGIDNIKRSLRKASETEIIKLTRLLPFLATTGNTAPFIGLFGTVWGIMNSFQGIGLKGSASLAVVAPGISEALIATAIGLAAAIPAVIAYNYFLSKINIIEAELRSFSTDLLNMIEREK